MSSIMSVSSASSTEEGIPSRQPMRASIPAASSRAGRTRSGSLGVYASHPAKRMLINTHVSDVSCFTSLASVQVRAVLLAGCAQQGSSDPSRGRCNAMR
jgi:hypothetical protein